MSEEDKQTMPPPSSSWTTAPATSQNPSGGTTDTQFSERSQSVLSQSQSPNSDSTTSAKRPRIEIEETETFHSSELNSSTSTKPSGQTQSHGQHSNFGPSIIPSTSGGSLRSSAYWHDDMNVNRQRYPPQHSPYTQPLPGPAQLPLFPFPTSMGYPPPPPPLPHPHGPDQPFSIPSSTFNTSLKYTPIVGLAPVVTQSSSHSRPPTPITPHAPGGFPNPDSNQDFHPSPLGDGLGLAYTNYPHPQHYVHHPIPTYIPPSIQSQNSGSGLGPLMTTSILRPPSTAGSSLDSPTPIATGTAGAYQPSPSPPLQSVAVPSSTSNVQDSPIPSLEQLQSTPVTTVKPKGKHKGIPGPKARIPTEAKIAIAEHVISKGVAMANLDELAQMTGLTKQQIKSQLVDNRQNVRKQLSEFARGLQ
ncbi:uncharacterized protein L199_007241 [Kwoniella botswanensis]|uniref:uncharacterized protein n=1 Tax=Kwoniella botswanensis TaxID=1268659 RepID=UPI00315D7431